MTYVKNGWYVAAWQEEITDQPLARRLGDEPVVLYRGHDGRAVALLDRCPHRGAALSLGEVTPDGLQCNYHGLVFARDGKCVVIPNQDRIPSQACVKSFPLVEKDGMAWIWLGDPALADESKIVDYPYHNDGKTWPRRNGMIRIEGHYMLLIDNLMDLTHIGYMHKRTIGSGPGAEYADALMDVKRNERGVRMTRWIFDHTPPNTYVKAVGFKGKVDRWHEMDFVSPGAVMMYAGASDAGTGAYENNTRDDGGVKLRIFHAATPETGSSFHYFFSMMTGFNQDNPKTIEFYESEVLKTFPEDAAFVASQQKRLEEIPQPQIDTMHDAARVQVRRYYQDKLAQETQQAQEGQLAQAAA
jgi:vanillate O-demethylase monooxygenase subunit